MRRIWMILLAVLMLTGCKTISDIRPDTIVDIPLHPTGLQTEAVTEFVAEGTEPPAETEPVPAMTEPEQSAAQPPKNNTGSSSKTSGGKKPSQGSTGKKPPTATEPAETAASTEPPTQVPTQPPVYDPSGYVPGDLDRTVAELIDIQRQAEGLAALRFDDRLCAIASVRARELVHTWHSSRPDGSPGITVLAEYGYNYAAAAENLYYGSSDAAAMVDKWMSSKYHRANILLEEADAIGVGSCVFDGITFVAVLFTG